VNELLARPFPAEAATVKESLVAHGDRAVRGIVEAVKNDSGASPERINFLFDVLTSIGTPNAQVAMVELLDDPRPIVRGRAADELATNLAHCATPALIERLQDTAVYSDDVTRKKSLTVGEAADEALQKLTGIRKAGTDTDSPASRAPEFKAWWAANGPRLMCSDDWKK
jgi:HEAT repeat protein